MAARAAVQLAPQLIDLCAQLRVFQCPDAGARQHDDIPATDTMTIKGGLMAKAFADNTFDAIAFVREADVLLGDDEPQPGAGGKVGVGASEDEDFFAGDFQDGSVKHPLEVGGRQQAR